MPWFNADIVSLFLRRPAALADRCGAEERQQFLVVANDPLDQAVMLGKRGRPKKGEEKGSSTTIIGRGRAYILARLRVDGGDSGPVARAARRGRAARPGARNRAGLSELRAPDRRACGLLCGSIFYG